MLFGPSVGAFGVAAHVVESHLVFGLTRMGLKEDGQLGVASGTRMLACARQCRVRDDVGHDLRELVDLVRDLVHEYARVVGFFLVITVSTLYFSYCFKMKITKEK